MKTTPNSSFILRPRPSHSLRASVPSCLRAFSIIEVMFAIMILGIGFILVAAIFPVAIQQSQATVDETQGRLVAQNGAHMLAGTFRAMLPADKALFAVAATYAPLPVPYLDQWRYDPQDTRYSWVALYRRAATPPEMDVIVVGIRATTTSDVAFSHIANTHFATGAVTASATVYGSPTEVNLGGEMAEAAVEGAVLINDTDKTKQYRLARFNDISGRWQLEPGSPAFTDGTYFLLGRALRDPSQAWNTATNPYEGPCQVTSVVTVQARMP